MDEREPDKACTIAVLEVLEVDILWPRWVNPATFSVLEVLEVDILWPRWVARIATYF